MTDLAYFLTGMLCCSIGIITTLYLPGRLHK